MEDQRAFQLALELSMLSLGEPLPTPGSLASPLGFAPPPEDRAKKSQNMTECVPVPSSEHVAEIVGRQGTAARSRLSRFTPAARLTPANSCRGYPVSDGRGAVPPLCKGARAAGRF